MLSPETFFADLAVNLTTELITRGAAHLRDAAFGDDETRALRRAWESAFRAMLDDVAADRDEEQAHLLDDLLRDFVRAEGVADALLDLALADHALDLALLRQRFDGLDYDAATLPVEFDAALTALTRGLTDALLETAMKPESPLYNRVSLVRVAAIHSLLRDQRGTLETIAATVQRLEDQLPAAKYNLVFLGPTSGFAIGDQATVQQAADLQPLLERALDLLTEIAAAQAQPSSEVSPTTRVDTGGGPYIDGDVYVNGDFVGRDKIERASSETEPMASREDIKTSVKLFEQRYLQQIFGGRRESLAHLNQWLAQEEKRAAILSAPAGLGKSALAVQWVSRLRQRDEVDVAYHPINLRFETNRREDVLRSLVSQLVDIYKEEPEVNSLQAKLSELLLEPPDLERPLVVVIDGLDELDTMPDEGIALPLPASGIHLLVTARTAVEDPSQDAAYWRRMLKWEFAPSDYFQIDPLTKLDVEDVIRQKELVGISEDSLDPLIDKLLYLSEGHPLLINLYLEKLDEGDITVKEFLKREIQPGLWPYIEKVEEQLKEDEAYDGDLLGILSAALGPLYYEDLRKVGVQTPLCEIVEIAKNSRGLVIGNGTRQGFALSHPVIGYAYAENHPREVERFQARFVEYGQRVFQKLTQGELGHDEVPPYVLNYYAKHLLKSQEEDVEEQLFALVCEDWMQAHFNNSASYDTFRRDVQLVWRKAEEEGKSLFYKESPPMNSRIADILKAQIKCALSTASVAALAGNLPALLPALLVRDKIECWEVSQARAFADAIPDTLQRVKTKVSLLEMEGLGISERSQSQIATEILLDLKIGEGSEVERCCALMRLLEVCESLSKRQLEQALGIAGSFSDPLWRARGLAPLMSRLAGRQLQIETIKDVILACVEIERRRDSEDFHYFPYLYSEIADNLPVQPLESALEQAFKNRQVQHGNIYEFFGKLAWHISNEQAEGFVDAAYAYISLTGVARVLSRLSPNLSDEVALQLAEDFSSRYKRAPIWDKEFWYRGWNGCSPAIIILAAHRTEPTYQHRLLNIAGELIREYGDEETSFTESELWIFCGVVSGKYSDEEVADLISRKEFLTEFFDGHRFNLFSQEIIDCLGPQSIKAVLKPATRTSEQDDFYHYLFIGKSGYFLPKVASRLSDEEWPLIYKIGAGRYEYATLGYIRATAQNINREGTPDKLRQEIVEWAVEGFYGSKLDAWYEMLRSVAPHVKTALFSDEEFVSGNLRGIQVMAPEIPERARQSALPIMFSLPDWVTSRQRALEVTSKIVQHLADENTRKLWLEKLLRHCMSIDDTVQRVTILSDLADRVKGLARWRILRERTRMSRKAEAHQRGIEHWYLKRSIESWTEKVSRSDKPFYSSLISPLATRLSSLVDSPALGKPILTAFTLVLKIMAAPVNFLRQIRAFLHQCRWTRKARRHHVRITPQGMLLAWDVVISEEELGKLQARVRDLNQILDQKGRQEAFLHIADIISHLNITAPYNIFEAYIEHVEEIWGELEARHIPDALEALSNFSKIDHTYPYRILIPPILLKRPGLLPDLLKILEDYPWKEDEAINYTVAAYFLDGSEQLSVLKKAGKVFRSTPSDERASIAWALSGMASYATSSSIPEILSWLSQYPSVSPLVKLAPKIAHNDEHIEEAFQIARKLGRERPVHRFVCALAPYLDSEGIVSAVQLIIDRKIAPEVQRSLIPSPIGDDVDEPLASCYCLANACLELSNDAVYDAWSGILRVLSSQPRDIFLGHIRWWVQAITELGGGKAAVDMAHVIVEISDWQWYPES